MIHAPRRLMDEGHELAGIFTFECDNVFNFNIKTAELARELDIPITQDQPTPDDIQKFIDDGVECFICAGYPFKIPPIDEEHAYGINVHPAYLPKGRGIMPTPFIILGQENAAGFSIHKLTEKFDAGDIIGQKKFILTPHESVETYAARVALAAPEMLSEIMDDIATFWHDAAPQDEESARYFPLPDDEMRLLDWQSTTAEINQTARAFGRFGCIAHFADQDWVIYELDTWEEDHDFVPGAVVWEGAGREALIAAADGFVCLKDFQILAPNQGNPNAA